MKKEDLIKKAAERGITLDEATAENYSNLSDEELANLDISGGCGKGYTEPYIGMGDEAVNCTYYENSKGNAAQKNCFDCRYLGKETVTGIKATYNVCKHERKRIYS
ncbi:MAG: hypothetical protein LBL80_01090 [Ruminococcus sp.]|jgi:hypothetical protein|nr:hypothetical protein [Ruminococcus sp.]